MRSRAARIILLLFLVAALLCGAAGTAAADVQSTLSPALRRSIWKHAKIRPARATLARVRRYETLIRYVTSLSFLRAGHRVDADYLRALILAESAGDPSAVSSKGARGLTQILPTTGREAAAALGATGYDFRYVDERKLRRFRPEYLFDPAINLLLAAYLTEVYNQRYGGRLDLVLGAWNAGPGAVERAGMRCPDFTETVGLVGRLNGYFLYLRRMRPVSLARR